MQFSRLSALLKNLIHSDKFLRFSSNYQLWKLKKVRLVQFNWRKQGGEVHIVNMRQLEMKTSLRAKLFIIIVQVYESECDDQKNFLAAWGLKTNFLPWCKNEVVRYLVGRLHVRPNISRCIFSPSFHPFVEYSYKSIRSKRHHFFFQMIVRGKNMNISLHPNPNWKWIAI